MDVEFMFGVIHVHSKQQTANSKLSHRFWCGSVFIVIDLL